MIIIQLLDVISAFTDLRVQQLLPLRLQVEHHPVHGTGEGQSPAQQGEEHHIGEECCGWCAGPGQWSALAGPWGILLLGTTYGQIAVSVDEVGAFQSGLPSVMTWSTMVFPSSQLYSPFLSSRNCNLLDTRGFDRSKRTVLNFQCRFRNIVLHCKFYERMLELSYHALGFGASDGAVPVK